MVHHLWPTAYYLDWATEGVKLFFVISGFLITQILLSARAGAEGCLRLKLTALGRFYARRFLRIFPLYYGVIVVALLVGLPPTRDILGWLLSYLLNFKIGSQGYYDAQFAHFWSLCVEEQFYLFWPWIIFFLSKRLLSVAPYLLIAGAICFRIAYMVLGYKLTTGLGTYVLPFASLDSLGLGALVAILAARHPPEKVTRILRRMAVPATVLLLLMSVLRLKLHSLAWGLFLIKDLLEGCMFSALVWASVQGIRGMTGSLLSFPIPVFLGKISYGLYVYHPFAEGILGWLCRQLHLPMVQPDSFFSFVMNSGLAILISSLSWYLYEAPLSSLKRHFADPHSERIRDSNPVFAEERTLN